MTSFMNDPLLNLSVVLWFFLQVDQLQNNGHPAHGHGALRHNLRHNRRQKSETNKIKYSGDLKSDLIWILNGPKEVEFQMVWIWNGIWNPEALTF